MLMFSAVIRYNVIILNSTKSESLSLKSFRCKCEGEKMCQYKRGLYHWESNLQHNKMLNNLKYT